MWAINSDDTTLNEMIAGKLRMRRTPAAISTYLPVSDGSSAAAGGLQNCTDGKPQVTPITMIKTSRFTVASIITGDSNICINVQQMTTYHIRSQFCLFLPNLRRWLCSLQKCKTDLLMM